MHTRTLRILSAAALIGGSFLATAASAQVNPEEGGVWVPPPDDTGGAGPSGTAGTSDPSGGGASDGGQQSPAWYQGGPTGQQTAETPPAASSGEAPPDAASGPADDGSQDDHERVVGRLAVGFMGLSTVPIGTPAGGPPTIDTVSAPALGIRYWVDELIGVDVGLGFGFQGGNVDGGGGSVPLDNAFAFAIHGGVPLAIFHAQHYKFLIIPEVNLGFSTGTTFGATSTEDRGRSGVLFQLGGRLGTEIHFGFMDIPQLSLQASVGLYFEYVSAAVGSNQAGAPEVSANAWGFSTGVQGEPWDILLGGLTALYYF